MQDGTFQVIVDWQPEIDKLIDKVDAFKKDLSEDSLSLKKKLESNNKSVSNKIDEVAGSVDTSLKSQKKEIDSLLNSKIKSLSKEISDIKADIEKQYNSCDTSLEELHKKFEKIIFNNSQNIKKDSTVIVKEVDAPNGLELRKSLHACEENIQSLFISNTILNANYTETFLNMYTLEGEIKFIEKELNEKISEVSDKIQNAFKVHDTACEKEELKEFILNKLPEKDINVICEEFNNKFSNINKTIEELSDKNEKLNKENISCKSKIKFLEDSVTFLSKKQESKPRKPITKKPEEKVEEKKGFFSNIKRMFNGK